MVGNIVNNVSDTPKAQKPLNEGAPFSLCSWQEETQVAYSPGPRPGHSAAPE